MGIESIEFKTEVKQILDLMINSLYSHKEIFLRELVSNASDAIDKAKYEALTDGSVLEGQGDFKIRIIVDKKAGTLCVSDNGIGMDRERAIAELGTIAHSGTKEFMAALKDKATSDNPELIGQFGVGFYSSFMVADKVTVITRRAGSDKAIKWESVADGAYTVEDVEKAGRGTDVILHLKEEEKEYLDEWKIREVIKKYSDYIEHPVVMDVERERQSEDDPEKRVKVVEEETLNSRKAIWLKSKSEIPDEEYTQFYKHVSHDFTDPARTIHFKAEGTSEFSALLFIPARAPFDILYRDYKIGPMLYVKRVQIMAHCEELIEPYLRFVRGVVDSSDLPLNVSREILQNNREVGLIKKNITKKVLDELKNFKDNDYDKYLAFYKELGRVLKEGVHTDYARKETVADLLLFESTATEPGKHTTMSAYCDRMKPDQKEIYYIVASSRAEADKSPYIESFRDKGIEVLIMLDEIDDIIMGSLMAFKEKPVKSVIKGDVALDEGEKKEKEEAGKKFGKLIELVADELKDKVKEVRLSGRLKGSPCCLVSDEGGLDPTVEKMLRSMGQNVPEDKRILEINATHPLVEAMNAAFEKDSSDPMLREYAGLLYDQALLLMGAKPDDPAEFARRLTGLMVKNAKTI